MAELRQRRAPPGGAGEPAPSTTEDDDNGKARAQKTDGRTSSSPEAPDPLRKTSVVSTLAKILVLAIKWGVLASVLGFYAFLGHTFLAAAPPDDGSERIAILATMGAGTVALTKDLRALGLDVRHESSDGIDGAVSWAHALLYLPKTAPTDAYNVTHDPLCRKFFPRAWHPHLVANDVRCPRDYYVELTTPGAHAARRCWRKACAAAIPRWRGCALAEEASATNNVTTCAVNFGREPVVVARHPLRTVASLVSGFCREGSINDTHVPDQVVAAARLLGVPALEEASSCAEGLARYWLAYYAALADRGFAPKVLRREDVSACDVVAAALRTTDNPRLRRAAAICALPDGSVERFARTLRPRLRALFDAAREEGLLQALFFGANRRNARNWGTRLSDWTLWLRGYGRVSRAELAARSKLTLTWADLERLLAADGEASVIPAMKRLAEDRFGFAPEP